MAVDVAKYAQELMDLGGITDEAQKKVLEGFLANDKVRTRLTNTLSDIEAERGRVSVEKSARQKDYEENLRIAQSNQKIVDDAVAQVRAYEERYGKLTDDQRQSVVQQTVQDTIDKKTFEERMGRTENLAIEMAKLATKLSLDYYKRFGDVLDLDAVQKLAMEKGKNAQDAYAEFIQPKVNDANTKDFEAKLKAAKEEGFKEGASKRAAGTLTDSEPVSPFMANLRKASGETAGSSRDAFLQGWRDGAQK